MLSVALSGLVLICNFFQETYFCHLHTYLLDCFYEKHLKSLTSQIYFRVDDSKLCKQYQSVTQEMMEQICHLETVKPQEFPIKVYVIFCNIEVCYRGCGDKTSFQSFNIPKCIIVGLSMLEGLFSSLFYCESGINQYAVQGGRGSYYGVRNK